MDNVENIYGGGQQIGNGCAKGPVVVGGGVERQNAKYSRRAESFLEIGQKMMNISGSRLASGVGVDGRMVYG